MAQTYSLQIKDAVENFLRKDDWNFKTNTERGIIEMGINLKSKLHKADIYINLKENSFCVDTVLRVGADKDSRANIAEFITRANYGLTHGHFEMDYSDGEIRYHSSHYCGDTSPSYEQVENTIYVNVVTVDRYGDALLKVLYGFATPEDAVDEVDSE